MKLHVELSEQSLFGNWSSQFVGEIFFNAFPPSVLIQQKLDLSNFECYFRKYVTTFLKSIAKRRWEILDSIIFPRERPEDFFVKKDFGFFWITLNIFNIWKYLKLLPFVLHYFFHRVEIKTISRKWLFFASAFIWC